MTTISVVIPARNDAAMLAVCLAALARQSRPPEEILVVDNGSTDETPAVCTAAGARRVFLEVPGITGATAAGLDAASGELLARLDADSVPPADWLARIEKFLADAGSMTALTGPGDFYGGNRFTRWLGRTVYIGGYIRVVGALLGHPPLFGSNFALSAAMWEQLRNRVHRDLPQVHDDLDLSYQIRPWMSVVYDPTLRVGVSARPFDSWSGLRRRLVMAWQTFALDFRAEPPMTRRRARRLSQPPHTRPAGPG